jgi:hypothetical protein
MKKGRREMDVDPGLKLTETALRCDLPAEAAAPRGAGVWEENAVRLKYGKNREEEEGEEEKKQKKKRRMKKRRKQGQCGFFLGEKPHTCVWFFS